MFSLVNPAEEEQTGQQSLVRIEALPWSKLAGKHRRLPPRCPVPDPPPPSKSPFDRPQRTEPNLLHAGWVLVQSRGLKGAKPCVTCCVIRQQSSHADRLLQSGQRDPQHGEAQALRSCRKLFQQPRVRRLLPSTFVSRCLGRLFAAEEATSFYVFFPFRLSSRYPLRLYVIWRIKRCCVPTLVRPL